MEPEDKQIRIQEPEGSPEKSMEKLIKSSELNAQAFLSCVDALQKFTIDIKGQGYSIGNVEALVEKEENVRIVPYSCRFSVGSPYSSFQRPSRMIVDSQFYIELSIPTRPPSRTEVLYQGCPYRQVKCLKTSVKKWVVNISRTIPTTIINAPRPSYL